MALFSHKQQPSETTQITGKLQAATTAQLEKLARNYECEMVIGITNFERTAILKGIAAELAERTAEAKVITNR